MLASDVVWLVMGGNVMGSNGLLVVRVGDVVHGSVSVIDSVGNMRMLSVVSNWSSSDNMSCLMMDGGGMVHNRCLVMYWCSMMSLSVVNRHLSQHLSVVRDGSGVMSLSMVGGLAVSVGLLKGRVR